MSGIMKTVLKGSNPRTLFSTWISLNFKAASKPWNGQEIEAGGQWKQDKGVKEGKKDWLSFQFLYRPLWR